MTKKKKTQNKTAGRSSAQILNFFLNILLNKNCCPCTESPLQFPNLHGKGLGHLALGVPARAKVGPGGTQRSLPASTIQSLSDSNQMHLLSVVRKKTVLQYTLSTPSIYFYLHNKFWPQNGRLKCFSSVIEKCSSQVLLHFHTNICLGEKIHIMEWSLKDWGQLKRFSLRFSLCSTIRSLHLHFWFSLIICFLWVNSSQWSLVMWTIYCTLLWPEADFFG